MDVATAVEPQKPPTKVKRRHSAWRWGSGVVVFILVLLVGVRLALPSLLKRGINDRLDAIPEYMGRVDAVGISLWRGAYTLYGLDIRKRSGLTKEPFAAAKEIDFSIAWRELFRGKIVGDITVLQPKLTFIAAPTQEEKQLATDHRWQDAIHDIFPIDITFLRISEGEVRYINESTTPKVDVRIAHLDSISTGLRNRADTTEGEFPARIDARGETIGGGHLTLITQIEPLAAKPHFLLKLQVEHVAMPALNEFLRAYGGVDVSAGTFNGYLEAMARDGHYRGYFKPFFENVNFSAREGEHPPLHQQIWEGFVRVFAWVFKNHARDDVATRIPFEGDFEATQTSTWETIKTLVRHAFIEPLQQKLDSRPGPGLAPAKETPKQDK